MQTYHDVLHSILRGSLVQHCASYTIPVCFNPVWLPQSPERDWPFYCLGRTGRRDPCAGKRVDDPTIGALFQQFNIPPPIGFKRACPTYERLFADFTLYSRNPDMPSSLDAECWQLSYNFLENEFLPHTLGSEEISLREAFELCDKKTSPGFPWNTKFPNKSFLDDVDGPHWQYLVEWSEKLSISSRCFWNLFPKDEILSAEKVDNGIVRTLCGAPIEFSLSLSALCVDFNEKLCATAGVHASAVGFSEFRGGRDRLVRSLGDDENCFEGDLGSQDRTTRASFFEGVTRLRAAAMPASRSAHSRLTILYNIMLAALVVDPRGYIWALLTGNKSGQSNTIIDNTVNYCRAFFYVWCRNAPPQYRFYSCFKEMVKLVLYGDDSNWKAGGISLEWFNGHAVAKTFLEMGLHLKVPVTTGRFARHLSFLTAVSVLRHGAFLPVRSFEKMKASLLLMGSPTLSPVSTLDRVVGLRNSYFPCTQCNDLLTKIFVHIRDETLHLRDNREWQVIVQSFKSDYALLSLYCGWE